MSLSEHFTIAELTRSSYAIRHCLDNSPPVDLMANAYELARGLERVRDVLKVPLHVESGYRSPRVNEAVGGARNSQHLKFQAADIVPIKMDLRAAMQALLDHEEYVAWDQLIHEGTWLHVSFVSARPRGDVLVAKFSPGCGRIYTKWG